MEKTKDRECKKGKRKGVSNPLTLWGKWIVFLRKKKTHQPQRLRSSRRKKGTNKPKSKRDNLRIYVLNKEFKKKNCILPAEKISVSYRSWGKRMSALRKQKETAMSAEVNRPKTPTKTLLARKNQARKRDLPQAPKQAATPERVPQQIGAPEGSVQQASAPKDDPQKDTSGQALEKSPDELVNRIDDLEEIMNDLLNRIAEEHMTKVTNEPKRLSPWKRFLRLFE